LALIERERAAIRDTGHTTAHLTYVTDTGLVTLQKKFGAGHAQAVWEAGAAAIDEIETTVVREAIDCEFARVPGYLHAPIDCDSKDDNQDLKKVACLAQQFGFDAAFLESIPHFGVPGIRFADQARFHPRKYLARLIEMIPGDRSHVFERTAAGKFDGKRRRVKANGHWITFDRVAVLTNNPLVGFASVTAATLFQTKLSLYSSYVLGARIPRGALPVALFWDTKNPYDYLRVDPRTGFDYAIFGGEDQKTGQGRTPTRCYDRLLAKLKKIVPEAQIDHRWSGQVIETNDGLPVMGENADRQFYRDRILW
jgi:glycine/D-amino acid oxidase-like deaminating enzyme